MKRFAIILSAIMIVAACTKEPEPQPEPHHPTVTSLAQTSWVGGYDGDFQNCPLTFTWTFHFLTDSTGEVQIDCVVAANPQPTQTALFNYTFNGVSGTIFPQGHNPIQFVYDIDSRTIQAELIVEVGNGHTSTVLGGSTLLYPAGETPPVAFPVNTIWGANQQIAVGDSVMYVTWRLDFWEYGWGGQLSCCGGSYCVGRSHFWQYDTTSHTGSINIYGIEYPFSYDPTGRVLTLDYTSTLPMGSINIPIGGALMFSPLDTTETAR